MSTQDLRSTVHNSRREKPPASASDDEWINGMWSPPTMEPSWAIEREDVLAEARLAERGKHYAR